MSKRPASGDLAIRRKQVQRGLETAYEHPLAQAAALLHVIRGAGRQDDRLALLEMVLTDLGIQERPAWRNPNDDGLPGAPMDEAQVGVSDREITKLVDEVCAGLLAKNHSPAVVAQRVLGHLDALPSDDVRTFVFARLLDRLAPYVQVDELMRAEARADNVAERRAVRRSMALIKRTFQLRGLDTGSTVAVVRAVLAEHAEPAEVEYLLRVFADEVARVSRARGRPDGLLAMLGELSGVFGARLVGPGSCDNPRCPIHGDPARLEGERPQAR